MNLVSNPAGPPTVAARILSAFAEAGVELVFTVAGGPLTPFLRECRRARFRVVTCRHETAACIMAASYFRHSEKLACVALTSGPGAVSASNGVVHAAREQASLFLLSARPASHKLGRGAVQDFDSARYFAPLVKRSEQLMNPAQIAFLLPELIEIGRAPSPGPVNLSVCADQWEQPVGGVS
jgi:acetolactate synthase-1/2/3 large subunit